MTIRCFVKERQQILFRERTCFCLGTKKNEIRIPIVFYKMMEFDKIFFQERKDWCFSYNPAAQPLHQDLSKRRCPLQYQVKWFYVYVEHLYVTYVRPYVCPFLGPPHLLSTHMKHGADQQFFNGSWAFQRHLAAFKSITIYRYMYQGII